MRRFKAGGKNQFFILDWSHKINYIIQCQLNIPIKCAHTFSRLMIYLFGDRWVRACLYRFFGPLPLLNFCVWYGLIDARFYVFKWVRDGKSEVRSYWNVGYWQNDRDGRMKRYTQREKDINIEREQAANSSTIKCMQRWSITQIFGIICVYSFRCCARENLFPIQRNFPMGKINRLHSRRIVFYNIPYICVEIYLMCCCCRFWYSCAQYIHIQMILIVSHCDLFDSKLLCTNWHVAHVRLSLLW